VIVGFNVEYIVRCWHCAAQFDAAREPFCSHRDPTKICPFCLRCFCDAPEEYKTDFIKRSPKELLAEKMKLQYRKDMRLGELLIQAGKITDTQLKIAIAKQNILKRRKKRLGEILVMMNLISYDELLLFLENQNDIDEINLKNFEIDYELIEKIGGKFCIQQRVIPIELYQNNNEKILRFASSSKKEISRLKECMELKKYILIPYLADKEYIDFLLEEMKRNAPVALK
jgi:hypothetical protein